MFRHSIPSALIVFLFAASTALAQTPSIDPEAVLPEGRTMFSPGDTITVEITVGKADTVANLFGVSFILSFDSLQVTALGAVAGDFLGTGIIFFPSLDPGEVAIGMSITAGDGKTGSSGKGKVAEIAFLISDDLAMGARVAFQLTSVKAVDPSGIEMAMIIGSTEIVLGEDAGSKTCDFTGDGQVNIQDVIKMLLLGRENSQDPSLDWNGDGEYNITDAISLLLDIMQGTCP